MNKQISVVPIALAAILAGSPAMALGGAASSAATTARCGQAGGTCSEDFTGGSASLEWKPLLDACLTAGNGSGTIPACGSTVAGYTIPADERTAGQGALLLTPPVNNQAGAILSAFQPFPLSEGIKITFTTYTFGGSGDGLARNGADGIVFSVTVGADAHGSPIDPPSTTGGAGGAMGYGCSNGNAAYDGIAHGYLGLGVDEFGNFLNAGDNGSQGVWNSNLDPLPGMAAQGSSLGTGGNTYDDHGISIHAGGGLQYQPERIGLRGAGNTNWAWLQGQNPDYYWGMPDAAKVRAACRSGQYYARVAGSNVLAAIPHNYNPVPGGSATLPDSQPIANDSRSATRHPAASTPSGRIAWPIAYQLKISSEGLLSFSYSYNGGAMKPVLTNFDIASANGPLPASLRFGFSAGTGASNNVHEVTCFKASPLTQPRSAAASTLQPGARRTGKQIYLASYSADNWWGSMQAIPLIVNGNGGLAAGSAATWDGKCTLTSSTNWCDSTGVNAAAASNPTFVAPESRVLVTATGTDATTVGVGFSMQQALTSFPAAVQAALGAASTGQQRLSWLLGMRCYEQLYSSTAVTNGPAMYSGDCSGTSAGGQRARTYVLGDIIDSSPAWVGAPMAGQYANAFKDGLYGSTVSPPENQRGAQTYGAYAASNATRLNVVYVGSNDGYLHGFEAGRFDINGNFSDPQGIASGKNDGKEVIGYMPYGVLLDQASQLTDPLYAHQYMVDATPGAGDLFYGGAWHTWLAGGVGTSGKEIYALDVSDPGRFSNGNAGSLVIGDWTQATLSHLGNTVGTPSIARMHNGQWAIISGNGRDSGTSAGVYIGLVDPATGAVSFLFLDTGVGSTILENGIAYVTPADLDDDGIVDYLYAGDQRGNVWRFDVTGRTAASWGVSHFPGSTASACSNSGDSNSDTLVTTTCSPLFTATSTTTTNGSRIAVPQPITTAIVTVTIQTKGVSRHMLYFGTGQRTPQTGSSGTLYAPAPTGSGSAAQQQAFYGIWDWNMDAWNNLSSTRFASESGSNTVSAGNLQAITSTETTVTGQGQITGHRTLSAGTSICWAGSRTCPLGNTQYGWRYNLPNSNEQIIYNPTLVQGAVAVNTVIPPTVPATRCTANAQTGWTMAFDASSGGALAQGFFPGFGSPSGVQANAEGTPTALAYDGRVYLVSQTITGGAFIPRVDPPDENSPARVSWREIKD